MGMLLKRHYKEREKVTKAEDVTFKPAKEVKEEAKESKKVDKKTNKGE